MSTNSKARFMSRYVGPSGPHLSCLTETSLNGTYKDENQRSIHFLHRGDKGKNTCAPRNPARKGKLAKRSAELDRRIREYGAQQPADQAATKKPGSMNY